MKPKIEQMFSDGTVEKIEVSNDQFKINFLLYTEEKILITFNGYQGSYIGHLWNVEGLIEGISVQESSDLLNRIQIGLEKEGEILDNLYSFQITGDYSEILLEIIAQEISITK